MWTKASKSVSKFGDKWIVNIWHRFQNVPIKNDIPRIAIYLCAVCVHDLEFGKHPRLKPRTSKQSVSVVSAVFIFFRAYVLIRMDDHKIVSYHDGWRRIRTPATSRNVRLSVERFRCRSSLIRAMPATSSAFIITSSKNPNEAVVCRRECTHALWYHVVAYYLVSGDAADRILCRLETFRGILCWRPNKQTPDVHVCFYLQCCFYARIILTMRPVFSRREPIYWWLRNKLSRLRTLMALSGIFRRRKRDAILDSVYLHISLTYCHWTLRVDSINTEIFHFIIFSSIELFNYYLSYFTFSIAKSTKYIEHIWCSML